MELDRCRYSVSYLCLQSGLMGDSTCSPSQWGLVCDRKYLVSIITTLYFVGVMIGGLAFGALADR